MDDYRELARRNGELFKAHGVKGVVGLVPACTASLKELYPKVVADYGIRVEHFIEVVARRLKETGIRPKLKENITAAYHDPCQLSRYLGLVDEPREVLTAIEGLELREPDPEQCKQWSTCCGGGGLEANNPRLAEKLGKNRIRELAETGAAVVLSHCPACVMQLRKAAETQKVDIRVMDVVELLDQSLE